MSSFVDDDGSLPCVSVGCAVLPYDCPVQAITITILMVFKNVSYIPTMKHHLMPPFILREAGIGVNEIQKKYCENPTSDDRTIWIESLNVQIPLELEGVFSHFKTQKATCDNISNTSKKNTVYSTLESDHWNRLKEIWLIGEVRK